MAKIVTITNPLTGQPAQVDQLDHTAQQIDDGLNIARGVSNPNLLDNWYFANPVNQRGQMSYTGAGYGIDRWRLNGNNTIAITDGGVKFGYVNNNYVADQPLEYIVDGVYTLSVLFGDNTLKYATFKVTNGQGTGEISVYRGWALSFNVSMARIIHIGNDAPEITIKAVKLELGSQQTLAHQDADGNWVLNEIPDYGEQLRRCQRYCRVYKANSVLPCLAFSQPDGWYLSAALPLDGMRTTPSNNISDGMTVTIGNLDNDFTIEKSLSNWGVYGMTQRMRLSGGDITTTDFPYNIQLNSDLIFTADL